MSKKPISIPSTHPTLGTFIDNNSLQLVEVLGIGGYGVVYRAVETFSSARRSYAVKCLANANGKHGHSLRRQVHIREITLHQLASAHPGIVSLYRVVDEAGYLYIIMEFATDDDLFTQILHRSRYLGDNNLIKHVFLQIIDGVQYCHSLGVYHRDLKPENVLCFDEGYRVAITDFGLATTDKSSKEFRTGSIYHMSPECQVEDTDTSPPYSPKHNDIWSLGIILLNLVTGRNPWKSATADDPTYQAYLQNPYQFLPSVLPVSQELNRLLVQALNVDWRRRLPLADFRAGVQKISNFYSDNAILEGSLARCPWEAGIDLGNGKPAQPKEKRPVPDIPDGIEPYCVVSVSAVMSNIKSQASGVESYFERETWDGEHSEYNYSQSAMDAYEDDYQTPYKSTGRSSYSSDPSEPTTPSSAGRSLFAGIQDTFDLESLYDYNEGIHNYADTTTTNSASFAGTATTAGTDDTQIASSMFLETPTVDSKPYFHHTDMPYGGAYNAHKRYSSPNTSLYSAGESSFFADTSDVDDFPPSSPNFATWTEKIPPRQGSRPIDIPGARRQRESKKKSHNIFNPMRFFPRSSGSSWLNTKSNVPSHHANMASSSGIRVQAPGPPPQASADFRWDDHRYPPHGQTRDWQGMSSRYPPQRQYAGQRRHREREW